MTRRTRIFAFAVSLAALVPLLHASPAAAGECGEQSCDPDVRDDGNTLYERKLLSCDHGKDDVSFYEWKDVVEWVAWAKAYKDNMAALKAYTEANACCVKGSGARFPSRVDDEFLALCAAADPAKATAAGKAVTKAVETKLAKELMWWVNVFAKNPNARAGDDWKKLMAGLTGAVELAKSLPETSGLDRARIEAVHTKIVDAYGKAMDKRDAMLADKFCPKAKWKGGKLHKKLAKMLKTSMAEKAEGHPEGRVETLGQLSFTGKPTRKRLAFKRTTVESVGAFMCVQQAYPGLRPTCRAIKITFERTKPDGSRWNEWKFAGVGQQYVMACKNLKSKGR